jgi:branched-chain amino acid transport system permease protein
MTAGGLPGLLRRAWPLLILMAGVTVAALGVPALAPSLESAMTVALINCMVVVGLYLFFGNSGVFSFGQISFMAVGAYLAAWLTISPDSKALLLPDLPGLLGNADFGPVAATVIAVAAAGVAGYAAGLPLMRISGLPAGMATFALLVIVNNVLGNSHTLTSAGGTLSGVPFSTTLPIALIWTLVTLVVAFAFQTSRYGLLLRASREDLLAARAIGVRVERLRRVSFTISAALTGAAGALYAQYAGSIDPDTFYVEITFLTLAMLVIGGKNSLAGAVVGTAVISILAELMHRAEAGQPIGPVTVQIPLGIHQVVFALMLLVVLVLRPDGITGGREIPWPRWRRA